MKSNIIKPVSFMVIFMMLNLYHLQAQDSTQIKKKIAKATLIKTIVENKNFSFVPNSLMPLRGNFKQLSYGYDVTVKHDSLIVYLPYYGEVHIAPPDPTENSLDFTSTKFEYTVSPMKKGGWNILIKPKDQKDTNIFSFTIFENGIADLDVTNTFRDAISYRGYIEANK